MGKNSSGSGIGHAALRALAEKTVLHELAKGRSVCLPASADKSLSLVDFAVCMPEGLWGVCIRCPSDSAAVLLGLPLPGNRVFRQMHVVCTPEDLRRFEAASPREWGLWTIDGAKSRKVRGGAPLRLDPDALARLVSADSLRMLLAASGAPKESVPPLRASAEETRKAAASLLGTDALSRAVSREMGVRSARTEGRQEKPGPCPRCGSPWAEALPLLGGTWGVKCGTCLKTGPAGKDRTAAVAAWNRLPQERGGRR